MKAYDLLVQAETGLASITGHPAGPGRVGVSIVDVGCGMTAHAAILEALIARGISGRGQGLRTSLFEATADWMTVPLLYTEAFGHPPARLGLAHPSVCPYGAFAIADGTLVLISIQNEREWVQFCAVFLGEPDLPQQPGFESNVARVANRAAVETLVAARFATMSRDEARDRLLAANTAFGFVNDVPALAHHPALRRTTVATPGGPARLVSPPVLSTEAEPTLGPVPAIGEHSAAIRAEFV